MRIHLQWLWNPVEVVFMLFKNLKMCIVKRNAGTHICITAAYTLEMSYYLEILTCKVACRNIFALSSPWVT